MLELDVMKFVTWGWHKWYEPYAKPPDSGGYQTLNTNKSNLICCSWIRINFYHWERASFICAGSQIQKKDPRTPIPPRVKVLSAMELHLGYSGFCWPQVLKQTQRNSSMIFECCAAFHTCLSSRSDCSTYAPDESRLFWSQEKPEYPQFEPHARIKMAQVLGSLVYICGWISLVWNNYSWFVFCETCQSSNVMHSISSVAFQIFSVHTLIVF